MASVKGGDKLAAALSTIVSSLSNASSVEIGFLEDASYPDGTPVAMIAAINEFGKPSTGQPPRPFFRGMIAKHQAEWPKAMAGLLKANGYDAGKTLGQVGAGVAGQLQQSIADFNSVPLKPSTIAAKGFEKQLVDTGHMWDRVNFKVE